jgi:hypothetical protein
MMVKRDYVSILSNLSNRAPVDLDASLFGIDARGEHGRLSDLPFPPCSNLWEMKDANASYIGLRVRAPVQNPGFLAARLAAIALERQIQPVFLCYIENSGMQRFGFRVEQLSGIPEDAQQQFEDQLVQFWRLALVIDASEIASLS